MEIEYNIGAEYQGRIGDIIKDREYGEEVYENQYNILSKETSPVAIVEHIAMISLTAVFIILMIVAYKGLGDGSINNVLFLVLIFTIIGMPLFSIRNKYIRRKYLEEYAKVDRDTYFKLNKVGSASALKSKLDENRELLKLYKLVYRQQKGDVEVYKVDSPVISNEDVPKGLIIHDRVLFKEGDMYYQVASKGGAYTILYLDERLESMGEGIRQTVNKGK